MNGEILCSLHFPKDDANVQEADALISIYPPKDAESLPSESLPQVSHPLLAKETLLKKITITEQEAKLNSLGCQTIRQAWEGSFWFQWAKTCFGLFEESLEGFSASHSDGQLQIRLTDEVKKISMRVIPENSAVGMLIEKGKRDLFLRSGYKFFEEGAEISFKMEFNKDNALVLNPVIFPLARDGSDYFKRTDLEKWRFGKYFFIEKMGGFVSLKPCGPFFADKETIGQTSFNFDGLYSPSVNGLPTERATVLSQAEIPAFLERHKEELEKMQEDLVPPVIRHGKLLKLGEYVDFHVETGNESWLYLSVMYKCQNTDISFWDIWEARNSGKELLISDNCWINVTDKAFDWMDKLSEKSLEGKKNNKRIKLSPLEFIRLRSCMSGNVSYLGTAEAKTSVKMLEKFQPASRPPNTKKWGLGLYPYQEIGYQWLWFLYQNKFGGLLCDDMGLGKTHQAIALMRSVAATRKKEKPKFLVITPTSILGHWKDKLNSYLPGLEVNHYHGPDRILNIPETDIFLTSYTILRNDIELFQELSFHVLVLDEIQIIKNKSTATYQALNEIKREFSIGLTGTPIENSVMDIKNLMDFVLPGYLPGQQDFEDQFSMPIEIHDDQDAKNRLQRMVRPFVLRRTKAQVLPDLPDKIEDKRYCLLTEDQIKLYKDVIDGKASNLLEQMDKEKKIPYIHVFAILNYLKQICNHPAMLNENSGELNSYSSGKWDLFCEILNECMESGLKVVVFSQYVKMLKLMEIHLKEMGWYYAMITGSTLKRTDMLQRFREDPDCKVFLANLRAGGLGIDLTAASVVIHYDRWWNQAREDQATDRVYRLGQNKGVQVIKLITRGTLEEKIDRLIRKKQGIAESLVKEEDPSLAKQFTREELKALLAWE
jgi:superfamily II DNA or RNA helicase